MLASRTVAPQRAPAWSAAERCRAAARPRLVCAAASTVTLQHEGETHTLSVKPGETILGVALAKGISLPHDCQMGVCMTCPAKLVRCGFALGAHARIARLLPPAHRSGASSLTLPPLPPSLLLFSGEVDQSGGSMLSEDVKEQGFVLLCCSEPVGDCTVRTCDEVRSRSPARDTVLTSRFAGGTARHADAQRSSVNTFVWCLRCGVLLWQLRSGTAMCVKQSRPPIASSAAPATHPRPRGRLPPAALVPAPPPPPASARRPRARSRAARRPAPPGPARAMGG